MTGYYTCRERLVEPHWDRSTLVGMNVGKKPSYLLPPPSKMKKKKLFMYDFILVAPDFLCSQHTVAVLLVNTSRLICTVIPSNKLD